MEALLNKEQFSAAKADTGIHLVIAGAGTGKTKTIVEKVKNILNAEMYSPEQILILTFSRKAADEIHERIINCAGETAKKIETGTFHSFCLKILRQYSNETCALCTSSVFPKIIEQSERDILFENTIHKNLSELYGLPARAIKSLIETKTIHSSWEKRKIDKFMLESKLLNVKNDFLQIKRTMNVIDFEDMINLTICLLRENEKIREQLHSRYRYIFVDEYQDTSSDNFELLQLLLSEKDKNLFVVGDDWQSIYGFRDARIEYTVSIQKYFPEAQIHRLVKNYRSHHEIVSLSNRFIHKNRFRTDKKLSSHKGRGGNIRFFCASGFSHEADIVNTLISDSESNEIAVLYRNNWQGNYLQSKIKTRTDGDLKFLTIHSSKGLEFETIIIAGLSDEIIPHPGSSIEEERRLLYVALTRAKKNLYIIYHLNRHDEIPTFAKELLSRPADKIKRIIFS